MRQQQTLEQLWAWLSPVLPEDVLYQDVAQGLEINGRAATQGTITALLLYSFRDVQTELHTVQTTIDSVTLHLTFNGRHCGHFVGIPPTGRLITLTLVMTFRLKNGRVQHIQLNYDARQLLQQLGLVFH